MNKLLWIPISLVGFTHAVRAQCQNDAIDLNGVDQGVLIPSDNSLTLTDQFTIEAWVRHQSPVVQFANVMGRAKPDGNPANCFWNFGFVDQNRFNVSTGFGQDIFGPTIQPGTWVHYAWTHDGTGAEGLPDVIFVNGELTVVGDLPDPNAVQGGADITIGIENCFAPEFFRGQIDEVRVWKKARSESEIRETINLTITPSEVGNHPDLVSVFNFDGDASDSTGNNDGIEIGSPTFVCADDQPTLFGCRVMPPSLRFEPFEREYVFVDHPNGCSSNITVKSSDPEVLQVCSIDMSTGNVIDCGDSVTVQDRATQLFRLDGTNTALVDYPFTVNVEVCCVGTGTPQGCDHDSCTPYKPIVVPITLERNVTFDERVASGSMLDPISTSSGELYIPEIPLLDLGGPLPLRFSIYYASRLAGAGSASNARMGPNWSHNFDWRLTSTEYSVDVTTYTGRTLRFDREPFETEWVHVGPLDSGYALEQVGSTWELVDQRAGLTYTFDGVGRLTLVSDDRGNSLTLNYGAGQNVFLINVEDSSTPPRRIAFGYNGGTFTLSTISDGRFVSLTYDAEGRLASFTDAGGRVTQLTYDSSAPSEARLIALTRPEGNTPHTHTFDLDARTVTESDAFGNTYSLSYDEQAGQTTITDPVAATRVHTHSVDGQLLASTDEVGNTGTFEYDASGRRIAVVDRLGGRVEYGYDDPSGKLASVSTADGQLIQNSYTSRVTNGHTYYDLTVTNYPDGTQERFAYDANGNQLTRTDRAGEDWTRTYTARGQVATVTEPTGGISSFTYNSEGELTSATDPAGDTTVFTYDFVHRPESVTYADATSVAYAYDNVNPVQFTDEAGSNWVLSWDRNDNLTSITDPLGGTFALGYDAMDRVVSLTDALGATSATTWDTLGRLASVTDRNGGTTQFSYDILGRSSGWSDPSGATWSKTHDAEDVLTGIADPLGRTTAFVNDVRGRVIGVTKASGETLGFAYDSMGRPISATDEIGGETTLTYDARGLIASIERPLAGVSSSYQRDAAGRIVQATDPGGFDWQFGLDTSGRRISETDPVGNQLTYEYDERSRLARAHLPGGMGTMDAVYDAVGRPLRFDYSDGTQLSYTRDAKGRALSGPGFAFAYDAEDRLVESNGIAVTRDAGGRIATVTLAPGKTLTYGYDARNLVTSIIDWLGGTTSFVYDAARRLVAIERPNGVDTAYEYDAEDRVVGIRDGAHSDIALVRDQRGLIAVATRDVPLSVVPSLAGGAESYDGASQAASAAYDPQGRVTSDASRSYVWDLASRLKSFTGQGATVLMEHDAFDHLVRREESGAVRDYVWNYALDLESISIERQGGQDVRYHVHTPDGLLVYSIDAVSGARHFLHFDEMGNTLFTTDDAGQLANQYAYAPYGAVVAAAVVHDNGFVFQGQFGVLDIGDGLSSMRKRVYDSESRRFLSRDPVELLDPEGSNRYLYALANPLRYVDPDGLTAREFFAQLKAKAEARRLRRARTRSIGPTLPEEKPGMAMLLRSKMFEGPPSRDPERDKDQSAFGLLFSQAFNLPFGEIIPAVGEIEAREEREDERERDELAQQRAERIEARHYLQKFEESAASAARTTERGDGRPRASSSPANELSAVTDVPSLLTGASSSSPSRAEVHGALGETGALDFDHLDLLGRMSSAVSVDDFFLRPVDRAR